jgi:hypothetical protein
MKAVPWSASSELLSSSLTYCYGLASEIKQMAEGVGLLPTIGKALKIKE